VRHCECSIIIIKQAEVTESYSLLSRSCASALLFTKAKPVEIIETRYNLVSTEENSVFPSLRAERSNDGS
jgi:hypothetical protein